MYHPLASEIPTKRLCLEAIKDLFTYLPQSKANPNNAEIRTKLFLACYASLFPFLFIGGVGLSHSIGHAIGATYAIPHGITSCLSLAPVVRLKASNPDEAKQIARIIPYIGKQSTKDDSKDAQVVADAIANLVDELGLKTTLTDVCVLHAYMSKGLTDHSTTCPLARKKRTLLRHELFIVTRITRTLPTVRYNHRICDRSAYISVTVKQIIRNLY
jgi:alcohol dehydrogenase class IV